MDSDFTLVISLIVLILLSGFFSASETAFSSFRSTRMKTLAQQNNKRAQIVVKLCSSYDELISTILIGNNIVNIASATLATVFFVKHFPNFGITLSTIVMTILTLIFGEVTPKSIAKQCPDKFAMAVAPVFIVLKSICRPINYIILKIKTLVSKWFIVQDHATITENELLNIVDEAEQVGGIDSQEGEMIHNVIEFNDLQAEDIVTPRTDVVALPANATTEEVYRTFTETGYSRVPIYQETIDNIVGILNAKDFYHDFEHKTKDITDMMREAEFIPPSVKISQLLRTFQQKKTHIAIVVDEYGGTVGMITMEDILEELVGEIWDEHDEVEDGIKEISENTYAVPTSIDLETFFEYFEFVQDSDAATVNGWVLEQLDKIPEVGDQFKINDYLITVSLIDGRKAQEIIVCKETSSN